MGPRLRSVACAIGVASISLVGSVAWSAQSVVYVSNKQGSISAFTIDAETGLLTPLPDSPYPAGNFPQWIAVNPTNAIVYVSNCGSPSCDLPGSVFGYAIDPTGSLSIVTARFTGGRGAIQIAIDPAGRFAYVANHGSNNVSGFLVGDTGALTPVDGSPFAAGSFPASVSVDPSGQFLFVANCGSEFCEYPGQTPDGNISVFRITPGCGALAQVPGSPFRVGQKPIAAVPDATGRFLYVADSGTAGRVHGLMVDPDTGALSPIPGSPWLAGPGARSVSVDPSNHFVYVPNISTTNVSGYAIDGFTGALTLIPGSPFPAGLAPDSFAVDPSGSYGYAANFSSASLSGYRINGQTGQLMPLVPSTFGTDPQPTGVVIVTVWEP